MFYNPAMGFDRDVGVALLTAWRSARAAPLRGWEMLAATGVRGLRLLGESGAFSEMVLSESHPEAAAVLERNVRSFGGTGARAVLGDARERRFPGERFDYIDIDPFGTPVPFVENALEHLADDGLLAVTATDLPVLAGVQPAACRARYAAIPVKGRLGPEGGLRILIGYLVRTAAERSMNLRPVFSYVHDHHLRSYLAAGATSVVGSVRAYPEPADDRSPLEGRGPYGPMWLGPLFDPELAGRLRPPAAPSEPVAVARWMAIVREEVTVDLPFYFEANTLAGQLGTASPVALDRLLPALRGLGYRAARAHVRPGAFRTDAPRAALESVVRGLGGV